jgi:hypothetical protein
MGAQIGSADFLTRFLEAAVDRHELGGGKFLHRKTAFGFVMDID